jgi:hypothetical protein
MAYMDWNAVTDVYKWAGQVALLLKRDNSKIVGLIPYTFINKR